MDVVVGADVAAAVGDVVIGETDVNMRTAFFICSNAFVSC